LERIRFCFRIDAEANLATDDDGNPAPCYFQVVADFQEPLNDDGKQKIINAAKEDLSEKFKINQSLIAPISEEEFDANTED